jgi:hypothetical protein
MKTMLLRLETIGFNSPGRLTANFFPAAASAEMAAGIEIIWQAMGD